MKHFIGGYAFGFAALFIWCMERGQFNREKMNAGIAMIVASVFAIPFALAAWGLLP